MAFGKINTFEIWIMSEKKYGKFFSFFLPIILAFKKKKLNMYFPEEKMKASKKEFIIQTGSWVNAEIACC